MWPRAGAYGINRENSKEHVIKHLATVDNPQDYTR